MRPDALGSGCGAGAGGGPREAPECGAAHITARQRARMADLSLLLDVVLKTSSLTVKKDFLSCGMLNQLHQVRTVTHTRMQMVWF